MASKTDNSTDFDSTPAAPFRLLDLPDELILQVLEYDVVISTKDRPINVGHASDLTFRGTEVELTDHNISPLPAVTQACKFLRREGQKLFYSHNFFAVAANGDHLSAMTTWIKQIGQENATAIANLSVQYHSPDFRWKLDSGGLWTTKKWDLDYEMNELDLAQRDLKMASFVRKLEVNGDRSWYRVSLGKLNKGEQLYKHGGEWFKNKDFGYTTLNWNSVQWYEGVAKFSARQ